VSERNNPLAELELLESAVFRLGCTARRLLAEHPQLPVKEFWPSYGDVELTVYVETIQDVMAWAVVLGAEAVHEVHDYGHYAYRSCRATTQTGGVTVVLLGTETMTQTEADRWRAQQRDTGTAREGGEAS
jgi:hypothetical protein